MQVASNETTENSQLLHQKAKTYITGGVNSPVRAFQAVGGSPRFIASAAGALLTDADGNELIDYVCSWGPMILGHAHPAVIKAIQSTAEKGTSFGMPSELEVELAEMICSAIDSIEKVRMVSSGTEATMTAIRLARGHTGHNKIIKFNGCYHGHADSLLVKAGSGALTFGCPSSPGIPQAVAEDTLVAEYNDLKSVEELFENNKDNIAAIIVEPIAANMNLVLPKPGFLEGLRQLCDEHSALLIFDEVITGFRVAFGGAQAVYNVTPDLTTLGKIIGGGLPVGALGGKAEIMEQLAPVGSVYQAGTLSGNPLAMAAGIATLKELQKPNTYQTLDKITKKIVSGFKTIIEKHKAPIKVHQACGIFGLLFTDQAEVDGFQAIQHCNVDQFSTFFNEMLNAGVHLAPSAFEAGFVSLAHGEREISTTLDALEHALSSESFRTSAASRGTP